MRTSKKNPVRAQRQSKARPKPSQNEPQPVAAPVEQPGSQYPYILATFTLNEAADKSQSGPFAIATARVFKSGADGFFGSEKITFNGIRYQVGLNIIRIGSKPVDPGKTWRMASKKPGKASKK